jgi:hypothetical protein
MRRWVLLFSSGDRAIGHVLGTTAQLSAHGMKSALISVNALEIMLVTLKYYKVCARWVTRMLTQEHKDH